MNKLITLLILLFWITNLTFCQDFEFKWKVEPSFSPSYIVRIIQQNTKRQIIIKEKNSSDSIVKKIKKEECDSLLILLDRYDFSKYKTNSSYWTTRQEVDFEIIPDSLKIIVQKDTIWKDMLWLHGYYYDSNLKKCYREFYHRSISSDGTSYSGVYMSQSETKDYFVYCTRVTKKDFKLNKMIYNLMIKYGKKRNYKRLRREMDLDHPPSI